MESPSPNTEKLRNLKYAPQVYKKYNLTPYKTSNIGMTTLTYVIYSYLCFLDFWSSCSLLKYFQFWCFVWLYNNSTATMEKWNKHRVKIWWQWKFTICIFHFYDWTFSLTHRRYIIRMAWKEKNCLAWNTFSDLWLVDYWLCSK